MLKLCENVFLRFLLLMFRQSMEQRNICVFNFCDPPKILKILKVKRTQKFPVLQYCHSLPVFDWLAGMGVAMHHCDWMF